MKRSGISLKSMLMSAVLVIALALFAAFFGGCSADCRIEGHSWKFTLLQNNSGTVIKCSQSESSLYPDAVAAEISVATDGGVLTITEDGAATEYEYSVYERSAGGTIYTLVRDGQSCGLASVGITSYADGTGECTLIVTVDGNSCYFIAPVA